MIRLLLLCVSSGKEVSVQTMNNQVNNNPRKAVWKWLVFTISADELRGRAKNKTPNSVC